MRREDDDAPDEHGLPTDVPSNPARSFFSETGLTPGESLPASGEESQETNSHASQETVEINMEAELRQGVENVHEVTPDLLRDAPGQD